MKRLLPVLLTVLALGAGCAGDPSKGGGITATRTDTTPTTAAPYTTAEPSPPTTGTPAGPAVVRSSGPVPARPVSTTAPKPTAKPATVDDAPIPDVYRSGPDPVEPVSTTTTTRPPITTTTTTRPVATTTTTTTRPAPRGEVVAESSEQVVWNSGDPYCKPVRVTLVNHSDTRVVSADITFYLYDFPSGVAWYWEGPYRKLVSIPADNGTRAPYTVAVDVCPRHDGHRWATHPLHPDYPAGVQLTWRWES